LPCDVRCRTPGALLPHRFTLACAPSRRPSAVCSLLHFPSPRGARELPGTLPCGARTFLRRRVRPKPPAAGDPHSRARGTGTPLQEGRSRRASFQLRRSRPPGMGRSAHDGHPRPSLPTPNVGAATSIRLKKSQGREPYRVLIRQRRPGSQVQRHPAQDLGAALATLERVPDPVPVRARRSVPRPRRDTPQPESGCGPWCRPGARRRSGGSEGRVHQPWPRPPRPADSGSRRDNATRSPAGRPLTCLASAAVWMASWTRVVRVGSRKYNVVAGPNVIASGRKRWYVTAPTVSATPTIRRTARPR